MQTSGENKGWLNQEAPFSNEIEMVILKLKTVVVLVNISWFVYCCFCFCKTVTITCWFCSCSSLLISSSCCRNSRSLLAFSCMNSTSGLMRTFLLWLSFSPRIHRHLCRIALFRRFFDFEWEKKSPSRISWSKNNIVFFSSLHGPKSKIRQFSYLTDCREKMWTYKDVHKNISVEMSSKDLIVRLTLALPATRSFAQSYEKGKYLCFYLSE